MHVEKSLLKITKSEDFLTKFQSGGSPSSSLTFSSDSRNKCVTIIEYVYCIIRTVHYELAYPVRFAYYLSVSIAHT